MRVNKLLLSLLIGGAFVSANAHDFWLNAKNDKVLNLQIGYGHEFPNVEPISEKRIGLFEAPYLLKDGKKFEVKQKGENFNFEGEKVTKGSYLVVGEYKPTFWVEKNDGKWDMKVTKKDMKDVKYCELAKMSAKAVLNVGGVADESVVNPIGQTLEIVPLSNPANFKVDEFFGVQVLFEGKPLADVDVGVISPYLENTHDNEQRAFWGKTDKNGRINIKLFKTGEYAVSVLHKTPYKDTAECDENVYESTFKFNLK
ncbi:DUF4198 domain-containing protein [Campylobacter sp. faydin G-24]|uniref:DUF4198 domain-containing protein n=1 Tax=Campylobacter anatolicus TaxID=2829105 RepID=A0ABS5HGJ4_9BACT|nr:DUF4198 domain-containing protein [Campylobacter anatolicus]MBR8463401.1 DUF4198 domain-containing protein [Campylobacter anatolicus]MBR8465248.1 DUF4198 domain-containing protein [Campylobacter anatolicus]